MTLLLAILLLVAFPAMAQGEGDPAAGTAPTEARPGAQYKVGPGDVIQIQVYGEPTLSGAFPVNDGGHLDYPLLGVVEVEGMSAPAIALLLRSRLGDGFIVEPNVTAWLDSYQSQSVQVLGAVGKPGLYYLKGETTVLQILSEAGGVSAEGVDEVRVTHGKQAGKVTVLPYGELLESGEGNITLVQGDIIFVPESTITVMGQVKDPGNLPFRKGLTVSTVIAGAGGALETANLGRVFILRGDERMRVNVRRILAGKAEDVPLRSGDRVVVGESVL